MANQAMRENSHINTESRRPHAHADAVRPVSAAPEANAERKRRMSEIIARVARDDHELLTKLAR